MTYRLGIDVGGTNTDAVILDKNDQPVAKIKVATTEDVTTGILNALDGVLKDSSVDPSEIKYAMLGTTHCTNAIVERKNLARVGIIRIGRPATLSIKPLISWPEDLVEAIGGYTHIVHGGHEYDGRELAPLDEEEVKRAVKDLKEKGVESVAISAVFSPVNNEHELRVAEIVREIMGDVPISLSHEIGSISLLERENAAILNAAVVKVAEIAVKSFENALKKKGIDAQLYITQNDGTLMSAEYALKYPVLTIASGPANSLRGGTFLSGLKNAVVVDVGGTTTDIGVLVNGFPRESSVAVEIGGVRTNFRMPDLISIGLGGGSIVEEVNGDVKVGPRSVGYRLEKEALVFGGNTLTTTDIAVSLGRIKLGDPSKVENLDKTLVEKAAGKIKTMVEEAIDRMKTSPEPVPVILVGGGSIIIPDELRGASEVIKPPHFEVANAIGAAIAQVSGEIDKVFSLEERSREDVLKEAKEIAVKEAIKAGADPNTVEIVDIDEVPLAYLPGNAIRIRVKAAGYLKI
ncbi:N-methylhydantoinase A/acetone carboxylase, beta subunit [Archaeoglobus sulfaticallidus PM70-1]|uniref:N-methylhydantoinase A/acetone carboxylase, beta subunit n=1 Tax=Archaeoglobus sulfaticallidus PM70-1 TaxID=387631 RepID=N0BIB2_9EURY|nr:hydantoinase/oxoprolinase family protein [Archaeoglobus sulfaticallidus]AGK62012.1 N-methylhydantoinase A/acetone carboxylase, beta subunit [Archaeoglobus sulfaticallidus PM70-1]